MKKVEVYFKSLSVKMNGDRLDRDEDLSLVFEWFQPNTTNERVNGAQLITAVKPHSLVEVEQAGELERIKRRIFKTYIEGDSVLEIKLLRVWDVTKTEKAMIAILQNVVGLATNTAGGVAGPIVGSGLKSLIKVSDKVIWTLGEAKTLVREEDVSSLKSIDLEITTNVKESLLQIYEERVKEPPGSIIWVKRPMEKITEFLKTNDINGELNLEIRELS